MTEPKKLTRITDEDIECAMLDAEVVAAKKLEKEGKYFSEDDSAISQWRGIADAQLAHSQKEHDAILDEERRAAMERVFDEIGKYLEQHISLCNSGIKLAAKKGDMAHGLEWHTKKIAYEILVSNLQALKSELLGDKINKEGE